MSAQNGLTVCGLISRSRSTLTVFIGIGAAAKFASCSSYNAYFPFSAMHKKNPHIDREFLGEESNVLGNRATILILLLQLLMEIRDHLAKCPLIMK